MRTIVPIPGDRGFEEPKIGSDGRIAEERRIC